MDNNASNWNFNPLPEYPMAPLANPSFEAYQKRVQELTEEGNVLRYELNDMKGKYTSACSSYTHVAEELEKSRQQETSMGNMVLLFSDENERMKQELMWVMREAIPRMLMRVLRSKEFDLEMMKVRDVIIEQGRELGRKEAQGPSLSMAADGGFADLDPSMMEKIAHVVAGLKKETWAYTDTIIKAPKLSYALLRYVLRHGGSGQGSSVQFKFVGCWFVCVIDYLARYMFYLGWVRVANFVTCMISATCLCTAFP
ncbi:hypothetical protein Tco_1320832 [Tanacetum coccineum]